MIVVTRGDVDRAAHAMFGAIGERVEDPDKARLMVETAAQTLIPNVVIESGVMGDAPPSPEPVAVAPPERLPDESEDEYNARKARHEATQRAGRREFVAVSALERATAVWR